MLVAAAVTLACGAAAAAEQPDDAPWAVTCDMDCEGVNTCEGHERCSGEEEQSIVCPAAPSCPGGSGGAAQCEPEPCQWESWQDWQREGSDSSGLCVRARSFKPNRCGGDPCIGRVTETMYCRPNYSDPVDCVLGAWEGWSPCDQATLQKTRSRKIASYPEAGGAPCEGALTSTMPCGERYAAVDCELGQWMEWSGCSRRCDGGQQLRVRVVAQQAEHGGRPCSGSGGAALPLQVTRPCNSEPCKGAAEPRDCELGEWSDWSRCVERDMFGGSTRQTQKYRSREVVTPGAFGGRPCGQELEQVAPCEVERDDSPAPDVGAGRVDGPADCQLSEWTPWTLCDKTCDNGQTTRTRRVEVPVSGGGKPCHGETLQTKGCNEHPCSVDSEGRDCLLSTWDDWSACSAQCGEGVESRGRTVLAAALEGGQGCNGALEEARPCQHVENCTKQDCAWNEWSQWGECTKTCDGGHRNRSRSVKAHPTSGGKACESLGSVSEVEACGNEPCETEECVDGQWDSWESWGDCSRSCGSGIQWRHRKVSREASPCGKSAEGLAAEVRGCESGSCEGDQDCVLSAWTEWSGCSTSCDGVQSRTRKISTQGSGAGKYCVGDGKDAAAALREVRSCNSPDDLLAQASAPGFADIIEACGFGEKVDCAVGSWSDWSECTRTCDGGQRSRNRTIATPAANGGSPCAGALDETGVCGEEPCQDPSDCEWRDWGDWGSCSRCDGERHRARRVARLGNRDGRPCEAGDSQEVQPCNECPEVKTFWCVWDDWSVVGECSATCGSGAQRRVRRLTATEVASPAAVGNVTGSAAACSGSEADYQRCKGLPQCGKQCKPRNCTFADWSDWSQPSCSGLCFRERAVEREANECGSPCSGELASTKLCHNASCDAEQDCSRSDWSPWTECTGTEGQRLRRRPIAMEAGPLGRACNGSTAETEPCAQPEGAEPEADCRLSDWSPWAECSKTCGGGGGQKRSRKVLSHARGGGAPCEGPLETVRPCGTDPCPAGEWDADCRLGGWSDWTGCGAGDDSQESSLQSFRTRAVTPAKGRGRPCEGSTKQAGPCPTLRRADCRFAEWAPWGECGRSCGGGQRFRTRELLSEAMFGGAACEGSMSESEPCNEDPCDADHDCRASDWSQWSACSEKCGQGHQAREREVAQAAKPGGAGCSMGLLEVRGCVGPGFDGEGGGCDNSTDCEWGEWREWGECQQAQLCGVGFRRRSREVAVQPQGKGRRCSPLAKEEVRPSKDCPGSCAPPPRDCVDGAWDDWGEWGPCSATCGGGGVQMRGRVAAVEPNECGRAAPGMAQEFRECSAAEACGDEVHDCAFGDWGPWAPKECSAPCNGARNRTRHIAKPSDALGRPCSGPIVEVVRCNPGPGEAPPWGCKSGAPVDCVQVDWSEWSECSAGCGVGNQTRSREVIQPPAYGGRDCDSPLQEIRECRASQCENVDCRFSVWEDWGSCDSRHGQRVRRRHIVQPKLGLGLDCEGTTSEVDACERKCQDKRYLCSWADWSAWGSCSTSCGPEGRLTRRRSLKVSGEAPQRALAAALPATALGNATDTAELNAKYEALSREIAVATPRRWGQLAAAFGAGALSLVAALGLAALLSRRRPRAAHGEAAGDGAAGASFRPMLPT